MEVRTDIGETVITDLIICCTGIRINSAAYASSFCECKHLHLHLRLCMRTAGSIQFSLISIVPIHNSFIYIAPIHNTCRLKALHNSQVHTFQLIVTIEQCSQIQLFIQIG
ncbi:hypothetical protein GOODEAATRI_034639 [Goodea atripinnis]|uniref:Uncharacterized protein n=1 Tax=Goodea atripinnis TaxID=208336 RepID=A0ABV0NG17_9TELE